MINSTEWSGVLFIRQLKGTLDKPDTLEFEGLDVFLMDIGTTGATEFKYNEDLLDAYDQNEQLMEEGVRTALVHSHHSMSAYFSPTDKEELEDNTPEDVDMYLSLVVNNKMSWDCKISLLGTQKIESKNWFKRLGSKGQHQVRFYKEEKVLYIIDVAVFLDGLSDVAKRIEQVKDAKKKIEESKKAASPQLQLNSHNDDIDYEWKRPSFSNISKATGKPIPVEYGKLLMLSPTFDGTFAEAIKFIDDNYTSGQHIAYFLNFFRTRYFEVLEKLKMDAIITMQGQLDDDWDYDMTTGLLDEILQQKGAKPESAVFRDIMEELESFIDDMEGAAEEEEEEEQQTK